MREHRIESLVIDTETDWLRLGQARRLAERLGESYHHITRLPPKSRARVGGNVWRSARV